MSERDIDPGDRVWHIPALRWAIVQDTYPDNIAILYEPRWLNGAEADEIVVPRAEVRKESTP